MEARTIRIQTYKRYNLLSYTLSQPRDRMVKRKSLVGCDQESAIHNDATSVTEWYLPNSGKARPTPGGVSRLALPLRCCRRRADRQGKGNRDKVNRVIAECPGHNESR